MAVIVWNVWQFLPEESIRGHKCPAVGTSTFWKRGFKQPIQGWYIKDEGYIEFEEGWLQVMKEGNFVEGTVLLMKMKVGFQSIGIEFVDVIDA